MTKALIINSAATGEASVSKKLTAEFARRLERREPSVEIKVRDVGAEPLPHLTAETYLGVRGEPKTEAEHATRALSDALIAELQEADLIVIGSPMYNFGMSSTLKTWFDHVVRAGVTFRYTESGSVGLVNGKKAIVVESRAGQYSEGPLGHMDNQEPHLRTLLGFIGIEDVTYVRAELLFSDPDAVVAAALGELDQLIQVELPLAA